MILFILLTITVTYLGYAITNAKGTLMDYRITIVNMMVLTWIILEMSSDMIIYVIVAYILTMILLTISAIMDKYKTHKGNEFHIKYMSFSMHLHLLFAIHQLFIFVYLVIK